MTNVEIIKDIKGFEGRYTISNFGIVRSLLTNKTMKPHINKGGYARVNLRFAHSRKFKSYLVHRLVAGNFLPNPNKYQEINHKDCNKLNNRVDNLEWCNRCYNVKYSFRFGTASNKGSKNPNSKLSKSEVINIRKLYKTSKYTQLELATLFKVSKNTIQMILSNKTWSNN